MGINIDFARNLIKSNFISLRRPYKLTLSITDKCNSKCLRCGIWKTKKKEEMSTEKIRKFFSTNSYFNWIDITGGEIFLRDDLVEIFKIIKETQKKIYFIHFPTNGILTEKIVAEVKNIIDLNFPKFIVSISLDGLPETNDRLRGVRGDWGLAVRTYEELRKLRSKRFDCYLGMTLSLENCGEIEELYELLKQRIPGFERRDLHFNIAHESEHYYRNIGLIPGDLRKVVKTMNRYLKKRGPVLNPVGMIEGNYQKLAEKYIFTGKTPIRCRSGELSVFVDPQGDVYPCSMWNRKLGNLKENNFSLLKILGKDRSFTDEIKKGKCSQCWTPCEAYQTILGNLICWCR
jgi:MoaA/NifB/PqqE/SkfB family radical SAM enzyme